MPPEPDFAIEVSRRRRFREPPCPPCSKSGKTHLGMVNAHQALQAHQGLEGKRLGLMFTRVRLMVSGIQCCPSTVTGAGKAADGQRIGLLYPELQSEL